MTNAVPFLAAPGFDQLTRKWSGATIWTQRSEHCLFLDLPWPLLPRTHAFTCGALPVVLLQVNKELMGAQRLADGTTVVTECGDK